MRKSGWMLALVVAAAVLGGCRSTACEDLAAVYADVALKSRPCLEQAPLPSFEAARCEQNLQKCGGEDLEQLEAQIECYQQLGTCQPERRETFLQALSDCDANALSNTCEAAIF